MGDRSEPAAVAIDDRTLTLLLLHDPLSPIPDPLPEPGAHDRNRTGDLVLTKDVLYRLSYVGRIKQSPPSLHPGFGAGDGNRTHAISLEG
jgi:hypothetical protein